MKYTATLKYKGQARWEEINGYDDLNIQPNCFVFQWFDKSESLIFPMESVESITTRQMDN